MEHLTLPHRPEVPIVLGLFKNVENAAYLREQLLAGNTAFEYTFLDAEMIVSRDQVLAACFRAINDWKNDRLRSRNVHSEVVFALSPSNNIAESFRRFGLSESTTNIIAIKLGVEPTEVETHLLERIHGSPGPVLDESLRSLHNAGRIRKIYRCEQPKSGQHTAITTSEEAFILGSMALRSS